jgi:hypothetical protein
MNCCNIPTDAMKRYIELCNLYAEYNRAWFDLYAKWYQFYLPKK